MNFNIFFSTYVHCDVGRELVHALLGGVVVVGELTKAELDLK